MIKSLKSYFFLSFHIPCFFSLLIIYLSRTMNNGVKVFHNKTILSTTELKSTYFTYQFALILSQQATLIINLFSKYTNLLSSSVWETSTTIFVVVTWLIRERERESERVSESIYLRHETEISWGDKDEEVAYLYYSVPTMNYKLAFIICHWPSFLSFYAWVALVNVVLTDKRHFIDEMLL